MGNVKLSVITNFGKNKLYLALISKQIPFVRIKKFIKQIIIRCIIQNGPIIKGKRKNNAPSMRESNRTNFSCVLCRLAIYSCSHVCKHWRWISCKNGYLEICPAVKVSLSHIRTNSQLVTTLNIRRVQISNSLRILFFSILPTSCCYQVILLEQHCF